MFMSKFPQFQSYSRKAALLLLLILLLTLSLSCSKADDLVGASPEEEQDDKNSADPKKREETMDYEALGVNEVGEIMILMYHEIGEPESTWCRTPANFRKDLETLYAEGYRLISMNDLLDGHIDVPAGYSPVVLTFDDGTAGQFRYLEKKGGPVLDPHCAVAILEEFYAAHPDFGLAATFYIFYETPFGQAEYIQEKLSYLDEKGFEIGNHGYNHGNLRRLSPKDARRELALQVKRTRGYLPGYNVRSLALPYGERPEEMSYILEDNFEGTAYRNDGVLLVGANPAPSPFSLDYDPGALPRVRASEIDTDGMGLYDWLERLRDNPERRYISDGDPATVAVPEERAEEIDRYRLGDKTLFPYQTKSE